MCEASITSVLWFGFGFLTVYFAVRVLQNLEKEQQLGSLQSNLSKELSSAQQRELAARGMSAEREIELSRLRSDLRLAQNKVAELEKEVQAGD